VHDSTTLCRIWDPAFRVVRSQSDVIFDKKRNAYASCLQKDQTDICEQPEETEYVEENETGRDGLLHDHEGTSQTGERHRSGDDDHIDNVTNYILPDAVNRRGLAASTGVRLRPPGMEYAPPVSRETVIHI